MKIKALTLHQPFAHLIVTGVKHFETRSWPTNHRGLLAIHAGKAWGKEQRWDAHRIRDALGLSPERLPDDLPLGQVVCVCELVSVARTDVLKSTLHPNELAVGNYAPGRYAWKLLPLYNLNHPVGGAQGLWDWDVPPIYQPALKDAMLRLRHK